MSDDALKEVHDKLIQEMPEGTEHDEADCQFCNESSAGGGDMKTYTEDELTTAVKEAIAPVREAADTEIAALQSELDDLRAAKANEDAESEAAEMQANLDRAEARAAEAESRVEEIMTWLDSERELTEIAEYLDAVKSDRVTAVKGISSLSDEQIESKIDRWAAMSDEDFAGLLEDLEAISTASKASLESESEESESDPSKAISSTAMSHTRSDTAAPSSAAIWNAARRGQVDVRRLTF